jgi:hypothetical protein
MMHCYYIYYSQLTNIRKSQSVKEAIIINVIQNFINILNDILLSTQILIVQKKSNVQKKIRQN